VQLLFHLMGTKPPKRAKVGKSELVKTHAQALEGLRQVRASLVFSLFLSFPPPLAVPRGNSGGRPETKYLPENIFEEVHKTWILVIFSAFPSIFTRFLF
jgi:hypothetical protein